MAVINGTNGNDTLVGGDENDYINALDGDDIVDGGAGNDRLHGGAGNDSLFGGKGNDTLIGSTTYSSTKVSILDGGAGNDRILNGIGRDIIYFGIGDGYDIVSASAEDTLMFKSGLAPEDITYSRSANSRDEPTSIYDIGRDLNLTIVPTGETITLKSWFLHQPNTLNSILFEDGGNLDASMIHDELSDGERSYDNNTLVVQGGDASEILTGSDEFDTILGGQGVDFIGGGRGNDYLSGQGGRDEIVGGQGDDTLLGGEGNDTLRGSEGNDSLDGNIDHDRLEGGEGNDTLIGGAGSDYLKGGDGSDYFDGGLGNDTLDVDAEDTYVFGKGDGSDEVQASTAGSTQFFGQLIFKSGLSAEDIEYSLVESNLVSITIFPPPPPVYDLQFTITETGETIRFLGYNPQVDIGVLDVRFEDGGYLDIVTLSSLVSQVPVSASTIFINETPLIVQGTINHDVLEGTASDELIYSDGLYDGVESVRGNGGNDTLVLDADDAHATDDAGNNHAHFRIRDFTIDNVQQNDEADVLDIGNFLLGSNLDASTIGNYLHIVSGTFGHNRSSIFVDRQGQFTDQDRANLTNNIVEGGNGADLFIELQGHVATNNLKELTGFADNTVEQFQALIDMGFLDLSNANSDAIARPVEDLSSPIAIYGTENADNLLGSARDDIFFSGGLSQGVESIRGNGGQDTLLLDANDAHAANNADDSHAHFRVRDFVIGDIDTNSEADVLDISDLLSGSSIGLDNLSDHLHIVSGTFGNNRSSIFIDKDGTFSDEERALLTQDASQGGQGADLFVELQGQAGNNNLEVITGFADNTDEQLQALINMGFLDIA